MLHILGNKITLQRGDSAAFRVKVIDSKGVEVTLSSTDILTLRARHSRSKENILIKESTPVSIDDDLKVYHIIEFNYDDTINLLVGDYEYEIILSYDNKRYTVVTKSLLVLEDTIIDFRDEDDDEVSILDAEIQIDYSDVILSTPLLAVLNLRSCDKNLLDISDDLILF